MKIGLLAKAFLLILYLTGLFRFAAYIINIPLSLFEQISFGFFLTSSFIYLRCSIKLFRKKIVILWLLAHFVVPLITMLLQINYNYISVDDMIHWSLLNLYFFFIFFFAVSFAYQYSFRTVKRVCLVAFIIAIIGFIINYTNPVLFKGTALMYGIRAFLYKTSFERAFGFYLQENIAGLSLITLFTIIMSGVNRKGVLEHICLLSILTFLVLLTGSRSSLFILAIIFLFTLKSNYTYFRKMLKFDEHSSRFMVLFIYGGIVLIVVITTSLGAKYLFEMDYANLANRINIIGGNISFNKDTSILGRVQALKDYLPLIMENPILGYGPTYDDRLLANDTFHKSSHNNFIQITFEHGLLGLLSLFFAIFYTYYFAIKTKSKLFFNFHTMELMIFILLFSGMFFLKLIKVRELLVVLGFVIGMLLRLNDSRKIKLSQSKNQ